MKEDLSGPAEVGHAFKSTQPRHEDRNQRIVISPPQEHPLPPPRHKPSVIPGNDKYDKPNTYIAKRAVPYLFE